MSLIVETGDGLASAESYISVSDADSWHAGNGSTAWAALTTTEKEQALRRATNFMTQRYGTRWAGTRVSATQALDWPRYYVTLHGFDVESDTVPVLVVRACAELALRAVSVDLNPDLSRAVTLRRVGPLETQYDKNSPQSTQFVAVDSMLKPLLTVTGSGGRAIR